MAMRIVHHRRKPLKFFGRLYPCQKTRRPDNFGFSIEEMATADLRRGPIFVEHKGPQVGKIVDNWVDKEGYLCVAGVLKKREVLENLGVNYDDLVDKIKSGALGEMSIHWRGVKNADGRVMDNTKRFVEATLTRKGFYDGCQVISVAASRDDSTDAETLRTTGPLTVEKASMEKPATQAEIVDIVNEQYQKNGLKIDPDKLAGRNQLEIALYITDLLQQQDSIASEKFEEERAKLEEKSSLTDAERRELDELRNAEQRRREAYAEQNKDRAGSIFELIKDSLKPDQHDTMKEALTNVATEPNLGLLYQAYDILAKQSETQKGRLDEASKEAARSRKDYQTLLKERDSLQGQIKDFSQTSQQTVEVASLQKRSVGMGVNQEAKRQQMEKAETPGTEVSETASAWDRYVGQKFPDAIAPPAYLQSFGDSTQLEYFNALQDLQRNMDLKTPLVNMNTPF